MELLLREVGVCGEALQKLPPAAAVGAVTGKSKHVVYEFVKETLWLYVRLIRA